ncbi:hypothetical protein C8F04DRAFT_1189427 [Mycena alexandri]|uniref:Uncharacterized protein n=1 Tax=Mycena alexandri TaxID=1745969 RepID=A0AAD6SIH2_9AGAR|nr:hypothetical protein C8F04DRAFT_1189427 [Mycena alexandri]
MLLPSSILILGRMKTVNEQNTPATANGHESVWRELQRRGTPYLQCPGRTARPSKSRGGRRSRFRYRPPALPPPNPVPSKRKKKGCGEGSGEMHHTPVLPVAPRTPQNCTVARWDRFCPHTALPAERAKPCQRGHECVEGCKEEVRDALALPVALSTRRRTPPEFASAGAPLPAPGAKPARYCRRTCKGACGASTSPVARSKAKNCTVAWAGFYGARRPAGRTRPPPPRGYEGGGRCIEVVRGVPRCSAPPNRCSGRRDRLDAAPCPRRRTCLAPLAGLGGCGAGLGLEAWWPAVAQGVILSKSLGGGL